MAPWADSPERSPPPRIWTPPVLHEPGFEAALRLALRWPYKWPYKWPYSGPRAAGVSGVNAGESRGPCRGSGRAYQQVRGSVILARKGWSGTLTRKRSLVQIQYGPPGISCSWPYKVALCSPTTALRRALLPLGSAQPHPADSDDMPDTGIPANLDPLAACPAR